MTRNAFFNQYTTSTEQNLHEDLIIESIQIYGFDIDYMPRISLGTDSVYTQYTSSAFIDAIPVEMYVKNVMGYDGEGDFVSRFGLEIRDQVTFTIAQKRFDQEIANGSFANTYSFANLSFADLPQYDRFDASNSSHYVINTPGTWRANTVSSANLSISVIHDSDDAVIEAVSFGTLSIPVSNTATEGRYLVEWEQILTGGSANRFRISARNGSDLANANNITNEAPVFAEGTPVLPNGANTSVANGAFHALFYSTDGLKVNYFTEAGTTGFIYNIRIRKLKENEANTILTTDESISISRPREGDLLYFPLANTFFEIKFVENEQIFYPLGKLQTYDLRCETYEYSGEIFRTGNTTLDGYMDGLSLGVVSGNTDSGANNVAGAINFDIQREFDAIVDFTENDPFASGEY